MQDDPIAARLITAGIDLFGREGLSAVGTRALAEAAGAQMSAITYHFGGKDGLYVACAEHIAEFMRGKVRPLLETLGPARTPEEARHRIEALLGGLVTIMMHDDVEPIARFVTREQMSPTPAFTVLYEGVMRHVVEPLIEFLRVASRGRLPDEELQVRCVTLMGQAIAFRSARAALMRLTGWRSVGPRETELARAAVQANVAAIVADLGRGGRR